MKRLLVLLIVAAACGDELPDGPGRPPAGPPEICQWKTPCQQPTPADGGSDK